MKTKTMRHGTQVTSQTPTDYCHMAKYLKITAINTTVLYWGNTDHLKCIQTFFSKNVKKDLVEKKFTTASVKKQEVKNNKLL